MIRKLRAKFMAVNLAVAAVMLLIIFCLIFSFTRDRLERESISMMESIGSSSLDLFTPYDRPSEISLPYFVLKIDSLGNILATGGGYYDLSDRDFLAEVLTQVLNAGTESGKIEKYHLRFLWVDGFSTTRIVFADTSTEEATLAGLIRTCVMVGALAMGAFFALSFFLARWAVRPVERAWRQQKQFVADASHELKTPITVILTNAELLQSEEYSETDKTRFSSSILQMAQQMRSLVERLLTLARMDNDSANMVMAPLNFSELAENSLLPFEPVYFERGLMLESEITPNLFVKGSRDHLRQVIDILLDNARKYSDSGSVWVRLTQKERHAVLSVSNPGAAMNGQELQDIFKRFYRGDKARTRDGGYGLGLPIAQSITSEHGGRLWAESKDGMNTFFLSLPLMEKKK